jgi:hypothetical protein
MITGAEFQGWDGAGHPATRPAAGHGGRAIRTLLDRLGLLVGHHGDMSIADPSAQLPDDAGEDIDYVTASFRPMTDDARALVELGILPRATLDMPV